MLKSQDDLSYAKQKKRLAQKAAMKEDRRAEGPYRGQLYVRNEDASEAEGRGARIAKTKNKKKTKLHELDNSTLVLDINKAIPDHKMQKRMADMATRIHTPERAKYFVDKATAKAGKRNKGIKTALAKIAGKLPGEKVNEGSRSEYDANQQLASSSKYDKAIKKIVLSKKNVKGNKHVDTEPKLNLPDKGTGGPIEGSEQGERNDRLS